MNIITLIVGLIINMENVSGIYSGHNIHNNDIVYYIKIIENNNSMKIFYDNKFLWYYDVDTIQSFKLVEPVDECIEILPGIPCRGIK